MLDRWFRKLRSARRFPRDIFVRVLSIQDDTSSIRSSVLECRQLMEGVARQRDDASKFYDELAKRFIAFNAASARVKTDLDLEMARFKESIARNSETRLQEFEATVSENFRELKEFIARNAAEQSQMLDELIAKRLPERSREVSERDSLAHLREMLEAQCLVFNTSFWSAEAGARVRNALRLLRPLKPRNFRKVRLGRDFDGGYVLLEDFSGLTAAISVGIDDDASWDVALAERGIPVYQFDHTITASPVASRSFTFYKKRVAASDGPEQISLDTLFRERIDNVAADLILKMDIEGDEWAVLEAADVGLLSSCRQLICEFHHLNCLFDSEFHDRAVACFEKLSSIFFVCHVHGNNCGNIFNVGNVTLPESLEVTFANRKRYAATDVLQLFPTELDMPNQPGRADIFLGCFRF